MEQENLNTEHADPRQSLSNSTVQPSLNQDVQSTHNEPALLTQPQPAQQAEPIIVSPKGMLYKNKFLTNGMGNDKYGTYFVLYPNREVCIYNGADQNPMIRCMATDVRITNLGSSNNNKLDLTIQGEPYIFRVIDQAAIAVGTTGLVGGAVGLAGDAVSLAMMAESKGKADDFFVKLAQGTGQETQVLVSKSRKRSLRVIAAWVMPVSIIVLFIGFVSQETTSVNGTSGNNIVAAIFSILGLGLLAYSIANLVRASKIK